MTPIQWKGVLSLLSKSAVLKEEIMQSRQSSRGNKNRYSNFNSRPYRNPTMKSYTSIADLIRGAYKNRANLVSSSISAFWTQAAALLLDEESNTSQPRSGTTEQLCDKVGYFLRRTEATLDTFGSNNMSQTLTAIGNIYKLGRKGSIFQEVFYDVLVGNGVASRDSIFLKIANVAVHKLGRYDVKGLSTTAITFARIGVVPKLDCGSNLFDSIAFYSMRRMREFDPQGLSTLV
jgi:hypothetical protein